MHRQIAGRLTGRRTKWVVLIFWVGVLVVASGYAMKLTDVQDNQASSWLPASAESTKALDKLAAFQDPNAIPTVVVYEKTSGLTGGDLALIKQQAARMQQIPGVDGPVLGPLPSKDHEAAQLLVTFNLGPNGWNKLPATVDQIHDITAHSRGMQVHVTGQGGQAADSAKAFEGLDSTLLFAAGGVVVLILLLTYRSPALWILPLFSAVTALMASEGLIYLLAKHAGLTVNGQSQGILTVLVFGAGTDYALLLVARYREELRRHEDRHEAMAFALHRASPAIVASGCTVILGVLCLLLAEMNSTAGLGPVLAIGIAVALGVMITLLPALLVITGRWIFWPVRPTYGSPEPTASGLWSKVGRAVSRRPRRVWVVTSILLAIACTGLVRLDAHGLSTADSYTRQFDSIVGERVLTEHGLADQSDPVMVVAGAAQASEVRHALNGIPGLGPPSKPVVRDGVALIRAPLLQDALSPTSYAAAKAVRHAVHQVRGAGALVGGTTAVNLDIQRASAHDNRVILPAILLVVLLVLMVLLRAVLSPLLLIATVVLSFGASLGLSSLLFHYVLGFAGTDPATPLFVFVFLVALGIDYNIFLMTRVREETAAHGTRRGSLVALGATGGVITSAGCVLAATFLVLGTLPLVVFVEIGIAVALGVMLDTLIVRSVLVTALNLDLGRVIWWPSGLDLAPRGRHAAPAAPDPVEWRG